MPANHRLEVGGGRKARKASVGTSEEIRSEMCEEENTM